MARTILQDVDLHLASKAYRLWAAGHSTDANKIKLERAGKRRPTSLDPYARIIIEAIRQGLVNAPPPLPVARIPAPFNGQGLVLLEPTGGTEDIAAAKSAGFTYLLLNIAYASGGDWTLQRQRAAALGMPCIPWRRVLNAEHSREVERKADEWDSPAAAHNLETEAMTTYPPVSLAAVAREFVARPRAVMTEPWAQNGAGWGALSGWVYLPETFQNANMAYTPQVLLEHGANEGMPNGVPMFGWGVWADAPIYVEPSFYLGEWPNGPFVVYNGDGREPQYEQWRR